MPTRRPTLARFALASFVVSLAAATPAVAAEPTSAATSARTATIVHAWITLPEGGVIAAPVRVVPRGEDVSFELRGHGHAHHLDVRMHDGAVVVSYARDGRALLDLAPLAHDDGRITAEDGTELVIRIRQTEAHLTTSR